MVSDLICGMYCGPRSNFMCNPVVEVGAPKRSVLLPGIVCSQWSTNLPVLARWGRTSHAKVIVSYKCQISSLLVVFRMRQLHLFS